MTLGDKLRAARQKMNLTTSQVAAATRLKVQTVEAIEREDFSQIPAIIYGKGFIKLYAECVGLDPRPLIVEYLDLVGKSKAPILSDADAPLKAPRTDFTPLQTDKYSPLPGREESVVVKEAGRAPAPAPAAPAAEPGPARRDAAGEAQWEEAAPIAPQARPAGGAPIGPASAREEFGEGRRDYARLGHGSSLRLAAVIAGILLVVVFLVSAMSRCARPPATQGATQGAARGTVPTDGPLRLAVPVPDPYVN